MVDTNIIIIVIYISSKMFYIIMIDTNIYHHCNIYYHQIDVSIFIMVATNIIVIVDILGYIIYLFTEVYLL